MKTRKESTLNGAAKVLFAWCQTVNVCFPKRTRQADVGFFDFPDPPYPFIIWESYLLRYGHVLLFTPLENTALLKS